MVQIRSLGPGAGNKIVSIDVVFPSGKVEAKALTEQQCKTLKQQNPDGYITFTSIDGETVKIYFDYYKYLDGSFAFILSEQPIEANWWVRI